MPSPKRSPTRKRPKTTPRGPSKFSLSYAAYLARERKERLRRRASQVRRAASRAKKSAKKSAASARKSAQRYAKDAHYRMLYGVMRYPVTTAFTPPSSPVARRA
jgi:regulator of protease activity HflC (stomatin/prohibitin superfamily)